MPPKQQPSKKTEQKQKEKVIEDKTFGLKNKKGARQQKFIQQIHSQVKQTSVSKAKDEELQKKKEKDKKQKEMDELNALFKSVEQIVPRGVDPKSIVCEMFKKAKCTKGGKCKFSHDLNVGNKSQKINIYEDKRDFANADASNPNPPVFKANDPTRTDIVCKYFLEAVEKKQYGWFWKCPNGGNECKYRHALPEGYVLKSQKEKDDEPQDQISLEDLIEKERAMILDTTKITLETFLIWKKQKLKEKEEQKKTAVAKKQADFHKDKTQGLSGREMFTFKSKGVDTAYDDDAAGDGQVVDYKQEDEEGDGGESLGPVREINLEEFSMQIIEENEAELARQKSAGQGTSSEKPSSKESPGPGDKLTLTNGACSSSSTADQPGPSSTGGLQIDEELFAQELNEDLEDLEISDEDEDTN